jgi:hypothetical protein
LTAPDTIERPNGDAQALNFARANSETTPRKLTETEARDFLAAFAKERKALPSHRDLAATWGWHRSKVSRLLVRIERETRPETKPPAAPLTEPEPDPFAPDSEDLVMPEQRATVCYPNPYGQVVIRQEPSMHDDEDRMVLISLVHVPDLIRKIQAVADEMRGD